VATLVIRGAGAGEGGGIGAGGGRTPFFFEAARLIPLADARAPGYAQADPFPHAVIDDLLPQWVVDGILEEFPPPGSGWQRFSNQLEQKLGNRPETSYGPFTRQVLAQCNSSVFVDFLERLTGIAGLVPDPHFVGGGLHQIEPGGFLKVHADFNRHPRLQLDRRLNVLVYLNRDWPDDYGGHLELWDRTMTRVAQRILPVAGRCVVFSTTSFSYHGHPDPLTCPPDRTRRSLALYYYSNGRPAGEVVSEEHDTLFRSRPGE
jgi:hypothetical protein